MSNDNEPQTKAPEKLDRKCPICDSAAVKNYAPFCSRRCSNIDLNRWLQGHYVIEGSDSAPGDEEESG